MASRNSYDAVIVGGGFYGCCLALFLRSVCEHVLIVEQEDALLTHASQVNQARIHTGFHYPRSFVTALRSRKLRDRFAHDFAPAVVDDFMMLYAIAARRSKVSARRFFRMFDNMNAPIRPAGSADRGLFDGGLIEDVFVCSEFAFDWTVLRDMLLARLAAHGIEIRFGARAEAVACRDGSGTVVLQDGGSVRAPMLFNVTYAGLNTLLSNSGFAPLAVKHELAELALISPPEILRGRGVTVMDGPFFSILPYPSRGLHSLTHVRYTPHASWVDSPDDHRSNYAIGESVGAVSSWRHMVLDARRYLPCCVEAEYLGSLFDVKTVLTRNEGDDGRPIMLHRHSDSPLFYSVLGGKIDNIYDLFEALAGSIPVLARAHDAFLRGDV